MKLPEKGMFASTGQKKTQRWLCSTSNQLIWERIVAINLPQNISPAHFPSQIHFLGYVFSFSRPDDSLMCSRLSLLPNCPRSKQCFCDQKSIKIPTLRIKCTEKNANNMKNTSWLLRLYMRADTGHLDDRQISEEKPQGAES